MGFIPQDPYCSLGDVKAALRLPITDTDDDDRLNLAIDSASRQIENRLERRFFQDAAPSTRLFVAETPFLCPVDDFMTTAGLVVQTLPYGAQSGNLVTFAATDYQLEPLNGLLDGRPWPYTKIRAVASNLFPVYGGIAYPQPYVQALVQVTAQWGWSFIPSAIREATIKQAIAIFKSDDVPFGATAFGETGVIRLRSALHPTAEALIADYYETAVFVA